jgi:hypothetical protein
MRLFPWVGTGWSAALRDHAKASLQPRGLRQRVVLKLGLDDTPSDPTSQLVIGQAATGRYDVRFLHTARARSCSPRLPHLQISPTDRLAELGLLVRADPGVGLVPVDAIGWLAIRPAFRVHFRVQVTFLWWWPTPG